MPWQKFVGLLCFLSLLLFFNTCTFEMEIPEYSLVLSGTVIYNSTNSVDVTYKFTAEEPSHRCRYSLNKAGIADPLDADTVVKEAGIVHTYTYTHPGPMDDGIYNFNLVVQADKSGEIVDLGFLDKTFEFYVDGSDPADPIPSPNPVGARYVGPLSVIVTHDEWTNPEGSPVQVYYEVDGSPPGLNPILYTGTPIELAASPTGHELWLLAEDEAGNSNGYGVIRNYSFMCIESALETEEQVPWVFIDDTDGLFIVQITGYGFDVETPATVKFNDVDGDELVSSVFPDYTDTQFRLIVDLRALVSGGNGVVNPGMGTITLTNNDPNIVVDTIGFEIKSP